MNIFLISVGSIEPGRESFYTSSKCNSNDLTGYFRKQFSAIRKVVKVSHGNIEMVIVCDYYI